MNIIIAGSGKVGTVLAMNLSAEDHNVTVIDPSPEKLEFVSSSLDVGCKVGNAASYDVLKSVDAQKADLLIAMTDADELNLLICLIAKKIGVKRTIARVRNPIYHKTANIIKNDLGLSMAINPEAEAASEMFRPLVFRSADQVETFSKSRTEILTFSVKEGSVLCDIKIKDLEKAAKAKILVCAIKRQGEVFIPNGLSDIKAGDVLSFLATRDEAQKFFKRTGYDTGRVKNLTIIGGGKLGFYLGRNAIEHGIPLRIIDKDPAVCSNLRSLLPRASIICADATNTALIEEEDLLSSSAVAVMTSVDETNILIAMYFKKNAPKCKVITKIKKSDFEDMVFNMDIGSVFNPKYITADRILRYVRALDESGADEVISVTHVINNKVEVLEFAVKPNMPMLGRPIKDLHFRKNFLLAAINRKGGTIYPGGTDCLEAGDNVIVVTTEKGVGSFSDIFE